VGARKAGPQERAVVSHAQEYFVSDYRILCRLRALAVLRKAGRPLPKRKRYWDSDSDSDIEM